MTHERRFFAILLMAFVAVVSPLLRAGAACARSTGGSATTARSAAEHRHGAETPHEVPEQGHEHDGRESAEHCAAATSCAPSALGADAIIVVQEALGHAPPPRADERAPLALKRAPEPPPPRA